MDKSHTGNVLIVTFAITAQVLVLASIAEAVAVNRKLKAYFSQK